MSSRMKFRHKEVKLTTRTTQSNDAVSRTRPPPKLLSVLVVDGEISRGSAAAEMIDALGHKTELAVDGIIALQMAAANRPDVVLLDVELQGPDACDIAKQLGDVCPEHPSLIVGFASHVSGLMRKQCSSAGMEMVLESPLSEEAVETLLLAEFAKRALAKPVTIEC